MPSFIALIDHITERLGALLGGLCLLMVIVTVTIVTQRYLLESGSIAMQELLYYLHACVFMLGCTVALKRGAHVRVDIFYRSLAPHRRALIDLFGTLLLLLPTTLLIFILSFDYVVNSWTIREASSEPSGLPWVYLLKSLLLVMPTLLCLQGIAELFKSVILVRNPQADQ